jgi:uncharacterized phage-like protein YoqJ
MVTTMMTGSRDLSSHHDQGTIFRGMMSELNEKGPDRFLFGGARGADTIALRSADTIRTRFDRDTRLVVIVPWTVDDQPNDAVDVIEDCADEVVEMDHDAPVGRGDGYRDRNDAMIDRADRCWVFWDGVSRGTKKTAIKASKHDLKIRVHQLSDYAEDTARDLLDE